MINHVNLKPTRNLYKKIVHSKKKTMKNNIATFFSSICIILLDNIVSIGTILVKTEKEQFRHR